MKPTSETGEQRLREACARLVRQVRAGREHAAEELLRELPEIAAQPDLAVELIYTEFDTCAQLGQTPREEDYLARFPHYRDVLTGQFEVHRLLNAEEPTDIKSARDTAAPRAYELLEEIARGSMGVVYRARHRELNRPTAIKMIQTGPYVERADLERFHREAEAVARLTHANIVQVYEVGEEEGRPFLALELVAGGSLADKLKGQPQAPRAAAELVETLARAMAHAHQQGILHRDLKPANVLLQPADVKQSLGTPKIADFGLARLMESPAASLETATLAGTPSYMAPEQATPGGTLGPGVDIYALGAILYETLTGRPPFLADTPLNTLARVVNDEPIAPRLLQPGLPVDLATICMKCLAKESRQRYATAAELADDLRRFLDGVPIRARPVGGLERAWKWSRRHPAAAALILVTTLTAAGIALGGVLFTLHLRAVADNERKLKADALARADELRAQLYTIQLAQVGGLWESDPGRALALLNDEERCPPGLHDFAWRMYYRLSRQDRHTFTLPASDPTMLVLSPAGHLLAAASNDRIVIENLQGQPAVSITLERPVRAWRFDADRLTWIDAAGLRHTWNAGNHTSKPFAAPARLARFSADGKLVALFDTKNRLQVIDVETGQPRWQQTLGGVATLAFTADTAQLAVAQNPDRLQILDAATGKQLAQTRLGEPGPVDSVAFRPDGKELAVAITMPHLVFVLSADNLEQVKVLAGHVKAQRRVVYSPDGKLLAAAGDSRDVKIWRTDDYELLRVFKGHTGIIRDLVFAASSDWLASTADDRTIRCWDMLATPVPESVAVSGRKIVCLAYSADGTQLVVGDEEGRANLRKLARQPAKMAGFDELVCHEQSLLCLALSRDGGVLATGSFDGQLRLWDTRKGVRIADLDGHQGRLRNVAFSADDRWLASVGDDAIVRIWNVATARLAYKLEAGAGPVRAVSFHPNGRLLAVGNDNGTVSIWDLDTRIEQARLNVGNRLILISLFSPDGRTLACGGLDFTVTLWDVGTWQRRAVLAGHTEYVFAAAFTPDSQTLATGSGNRFTDVPGEVKLWNVATGQLRATLRDTAGPVAFHPDGNLLLTVDDYRTIKLWPAWDR
ncbi:MAG: protein kinase [Gemmataceae bacterium]